MHFSNRAFRLKTTRNGDYHRSTFRIDTNYLHSTNRANSVALGGLWLELLSSPGRMFNLELVAGRTLAGDELIAG